MKKSILNESYGFLEADGWTQDSIRLSRTNKEDKIRFLAKAIADESTITINGRLLGEAEEFSGTIGEVRKTKGGPVEPLVVNGYKLILTDYATLYLDKSGILIEALTDKAFRQYRKWAEQ